MAIVHVLPNNDLIEHEDEGDARALVPDSGGA